jgi:hypothetical protein
VGRDDVAVMDGGTAAVETMPRHRFEQHWSGYLLLRSSDSWRSAIVGGSILLALVGLGSGLTVIWRRDRQ